MKILCAYSSIEFNVEHFPGSLTSREFYHPIFCLPQKKLLGYLHKWSHQELTPTDSYLLFLALLKSSDLVNFRVPAARSPKTDSIVACNMESLAKILCKLNSVSSPERIFPNYVISPDTKYLDNVQYWITNWEESFVEYSASQSKFIDQRNSWQKLQHREHALERLIKNPHKPISEYSGILADWAAIAGDFPKFLVTSPFTGLSISCDSYWKDIISRCARKDIGLMFATNQILADIDELLEHCETSIPAGSIHSHLLFKLLRDTKEKKKNFLGLGDQDITKSTYAFLSPTDTVESANLSAMIQSAPTEEPKPESYPTKFAYMKAKMKWDLAKKSAQKTGE
jgi:hypothetical protein